MTLEFEELKEIALKLGERRQYRNKGIINTISEFHYKWINNPNSKFSPQGFAIREINITINSKKNCFISSISAIRCFYSQKYEKNIREKIEKILEEFPNFIEEEDIPEIEDEIHMFPFRIS